MRNLVIETALRAGFAFIFLTLLLPSNGTAATQPSWLKQYSVPYASSGLPDGLMVLVGDSVVGAAKLDIEGRVVWSKAYAGVEATPYYSTVTSDSDGFVLTARPRCDYSPNCDIRMQLVKLDPQGEVVWSKIYVAASPVIAMDVFPVDGGYVVAGARGPRGPDQDAWLLRVDGTGEILWQHTYGTTEGMEYARFVRPFPGGYVIAGSSSNLGGTGGNGLWLMTTDANGSISMQQLYLRGADQFVQVEAMHVGADGVLLAGAIHYLFSQRKAFAMRVSFAGEIQWQKVYDFDSDSMFRRVLPTDGGYIVAGNAGRASIDSDSAAWVLKLDPEGDVIWEHTIGAPDVEAWARSIEPHEDGFIVGGTMYRGGPATTQQAFAARLQSDGTLPGCSWLGGSNADVQPGDFYLSDEGVAYVVDAQAPVELQAATVTASPSPLTEIVECPASYGPLGSTRRHCESILNRSVCELLRFGEYQLSIDERFMACPPACNLSIEERLAETSGDMLDSYALMRDVLVMTHEREVPEESLESLIRALESSTLLSRDELDKLMAASRDGKRLPPYLFERLAESVNERVLDLAAPDPSRVRVPASRFAAADFEGVAWLGFRGVAKPGSASLSLVPGLPSKSDAFNLGWPILHYDFDFDGALVSNGFVDIHLYVGGVAHDGPPEDLRMLEWDGKSYRDITTHVDVSRGVISGTTGRLAKVVVVSQTNDESAD